MPTPERIEIHTIKGKREWYASFYVENIPQNTDMTLPTPFLLTMPIQTVLKKIKDLNPDKRVIQGLRIY